MPPQQRPSSGARAERSPGVETAAPRRDAGVSQQPEPATVPAGAEPSTALPGPLHIFQRRGLRGAQAQLADRGGERRGSLGIVRRCFRVLDPSRPVAVRRRRLDMDSSQAHAWPPRGARFGHRRGALRPQQRRPGRRPAGPDAWTPVGGDRLQGRPRRACRAQQARVLGTHRQQIVRSFVGGATGAGLPLPGRAHTGRAGHRRAAHAQRSDQLAATAPAWGDAIVSSLTARRAANTIRRPGATERQRRPPPQTASTLRNHPCFRLLTCDFTESARSHIVTAMSTSHRGRTAAPHKIDIIERGQRERS